MIHTQLASFVRLVSNQAYKAHIASRQTGLQATLFLLNSHACEYRRLVARVLRNCLIGAVRETACLATLLTTPLTPTGVSRTMVP